MGNELPLVPRFLQQAIRSFADKRSPGKKHEIHINSQRLYILPTRHGVTYFFVLLLVLFGAINYENSLGYMLAFLLGSLGFLGMIYTHQNLNRLSVRIGRPASVFVGQHILFPITLSQPRQAPASAHPALQLVAEGGAEGAAMGNESQICHLLDEPSIECKVPLTATERGYIEAGRIKLFSEYPLGLFHAWSWLNLDSRCLVYPAPDPHHYPLYSSDSHALGEFSNDQRGVDDFAGIREYQAGDMPNHMAWKAIAKTGELQTKVFNNEASQKIYVSWYQLNETLDIEARLSILCRMVLDADEQSLVYGLILPGLTIEPGSGLQHKHQCLKALALFGKPAT